ncbi:hypothetical protein [Actinoplanes xinjiangensis]|jgi:hypothetical protein|uniref:Uncharacterized protein n=1 Tax=Actinoplanes xinjiangensis TaxID=512350 RepID=A0A316EJZ1_9ACTN|nr:hypothetical protein [Actinoplanes xinjiangensis]PWK32087.1 hypothetical protein BC793_13182 [Actinoplanes xinjiangensis]GIF43767.1 hypothetical protein Axi01nite_80780 [Actinoplanes xinjiangensis]
MVTPDVPRRSDGILSAFRIETGPEPRITFRGCTDGACTASAPYAALSDLVAHFASLPLLRAAPDGSSDWERLVHYLRELARTGELTAELEIRVARDRVAAHFAAATDRFMPDPSDPMGG